VARLFYGWVVVAGAFAVLFVAYGAQYSFGVFFAALLAEFGWSRASLAGAFSLYAFLYCVVGFPAGRLTDQWGPRRVIAMGGVCLGLALAAMAAVRELWQPYVLYGLLAALGMGTAYVPCNATVVKWFVRRRGLAVGLASSGASVGTVIVPPVAQALVEAVGWRRAYLVVGAGVLVLLALVALVMRRDPESVGLRPDGAPTPPAAAADPGDAWPLRRAVRTSTFWLLWAAFAATWVPVFIPLVHLVRYGQDLGLTPLAAASAISVLGVGAVAGRLAMGALSDRLGRRRTVAVAMLLQALAFLGFVGVRGLVTLYAAAFVFGYSYGAISTLFSALVGDAFGRAQVGTLVGLLFAMAGSMGGVGPVVAGAIYDRTGSYRPAFGLAALLNLVGAALLVRLSPPVPPPDPSSRRLAPGSTIRRPPGRQGHEVPLGRREREARWPPPARSC
jgi:OFA family oxalate/formate antiporter-like MFS transporter